MNAVKLYAVTFNTYISETESTVERPASLNHMINKYATIPIGGLVIREDEFDYWKEFGNGFKSLLYVGSLLEGDEECD